MKCDCSIDFGDYPEFYREEYPKARKTYRCCECGENIEPGQKYHKVVGKWDGDFEIYRTCMTCYHIRKDYCPNGFIFGELAEVVYECLGVKLR